MDRKKLVLLIGALIIAIGTAFAARSIFAGGGAPTAEAAPQPTGPRVLVAKRALTAGTIITADALGFQPWPEELVKDAYFIDGEANMEQLLGTVVRFPITAGEPVTQGTLVAPGDRGFLAAALGPGMRAVTVPVSAMTGVAGFVFPGDRVDLVLTQSVKGDGPDLKAAETVIRNLRVLATDQTTESTTDENGKTVVRAFRTVTLEVTPKIAEKVAVAQTIGTLSLALRSLADNEAELERAIAAGDIEIPANATPEQEEKLLKAAATRPVDKGTTYVTGGDVSRFQRKTVPPQDRDRNDYTPPAPGVSARVNNEPVYKGPSVRVTRGKATQETPVSPQAAVGGMVGSQANGLRRAGQTVPAAGSTMVF
ncbi:Flp pilus assembly protein CpaB [Erythrobacter dokdonensis]|jgi:pilus assembly protein CpaB|uniref:Pilus assembly protein CpaB n=1 Tax=Erythrobacter dokdonensis DSW-74 TaxID=1300349 RepID=A0A1A7BFR4_9SPHN|nr:Flp pilus assembly protein CpaB [Erythrobacter dokdonensis]MEE4317437.1 Flp pilus assembly protein CpaB [Erythrobacter sp.]OBV10065.1 Pilus assembly protein CpaB [Erythrobacter dokdonensis DSW-74]